MAKKSAEFNMAREIRELLEEDRGLTGKQVVEQLRKKFPKAKINPASCGVAFSNARKKLGIRKGRKAVVRKRRPVSQEPVAVDFPALQAAKLYLSRCNGDAAVAREALKAVARLQIDS